MLTRVVVLARLSRRNTLSRHGSTERLLFINVRLFAALANKTKRPSGLMMESPESPLPPSLDCVPDTDTSRPASTGQTQDAAKIKAKMHQVQLLSAASMRMLPFYPFAPNYQVLPF